VRRAPDLLRSLTPTEPSLYVRPLLARNCAVGWWSSSEKEPTGRTPRRTEPGLEHAPEHISRDERGVSLSTTASGAHAGEHGRQARLGFRCCRRGGGERKASLTVLVAAVTKRHLVHVRPVARALHLRCGPVEPFALSCRRRWCGSHGLAPAHGRGRRPRTRPPRRGGMLFAAHGSAGAVRAAVEQRLTPRPSLVEAHECCRESPPLVRHHPIVVMRPGRTGWWQTV
jgi:hypothetical protein